MNCLTVNINDITIPPIPIIMNKEGRIFFLKINYSKLPVRDVVC
jgi:hypothetical protein